MPQCNNKEVQFTDVNGYQVCISLDMASGHCGEGYKAMKKGQEFVCRKHKLDLHCPQGYVLSFDGEKPACVSEIGKYRIVLLKPLINTANQKDQNGN